jgi:hypothetical protein
MKFRDETAFRQALQQRLKDRAEGDGVLLVRNRKRVAFDRLLAQLLAVAPSRDPRRETRLRLVRDA